MIIEVKRDGELHVKFEKGDFLRKTPDRKLAWEEAKEAIKERFPVGDRKYDGELKAWIIRDTPQNRNGIEAIQRLYFKDENQEEIF